MLASRITDPAARTQGLTFALPEIVAVVDTTGHSAASLLETVGSILRHPDCRVWIHGPGADELRRQWGDADCRIQVGLPEDTARSHAVLEVRGLVLFGADALRRLVETGADRLTVDVGNSGTVELRTSRSGSRARRWSATVGMDPEDLAEAMFGHMHRTGAEFGISAGEEQPKLAW
jgi:hypothetical protein